MNLIHLDNSVALLTVLMNKDSPGNPAGEEQDGSTEALLLVTFPEIEEAMGVPEIKDNLTSHILSRDDLRNRDRYRIVVNNWKF